MLNFIFVLQGLHPVQGWKKFHIARNRFELDCFLNHMATITPDEFEIPFIRVKTAYFKFRHFEPLNN